MEPVENGYNDARFHGDVDRNLHCPICLKVFKDPVQCLRNQHLFCTPCISRHLKQLHRCPTCHEKLTPETLVQPPRIVTDMLSSLNITCDYVQRGCRKVVELGVLERHIRHCSFVPVVCSNYGCNSILNRQDKLAHERNECEFRQMEPVENGYDEARFHGDVNRNLHCPICLKVFKDPVQCHRNQHLFCTPCILRHLKQLHRCPTCHEELTPETLVQPPRIVTDMLSSLNITCDYVQRGCREVVGLGVLELHVKQCNFAPVACSNDGCKLIINRRDIEDHERNECEFREVDVADVAVAAAAILAVGAISAVGKRFPGLFSPKGSAPPPRENGQETNLEDFEFPSDSDEGEEQL